VTVDPLYMVNVCTLSYYDCHNEKYKIIIDHNFSC